MGRVRKKNRLGRPPLAIKRSKRIMIRALPEEHADWTAAARAARQELSVWIRDRLNQVGSSP